MQAPVQNWLTQCLVLGACSGMRVYWKLNEAEECEAFKIGHWRCTYHVSSINKRDIVTWPLVPKWPIPSWVDLCLRLHLFWKLSCYRPDVSNTSIAVEAPSFRPLKVHLVL
jgi:hypothetical protein